MIQCAKDLNPELALRVVKTFTLALNLGNVAEVQHRLHVLRENDLLDNDDSDAIPRAHPMVEDSVRGILNAILSTAKQLLLAKNKLWKHSLNKKWRWS
eukprot:scaffold91112_cov47-Attheya_sp.AAC.3